MKKILLFTLVSALLVISVTSCNIEPKENKVVEDEVVEDDVVEGEVVEDEVVEDEVVEDNLQEGLQEDSYINIAPLEVSPEDLHLFMDEQTKKYGYETEDGEIIIPAIFFDASCFM